MSDLFVVFVRGGQRVGSRLEGSRVSLERVARCGSAVLVAVAARSLLAPP